MKSIILLFSFFISLSFFACVDDSSSIGAKWVQSSFLNEQMDTLVTQVSSEFEREIAEKQRLIDEMSANRQQDAEAAQQQVELLIQCREQLQHLAKQALYEVQS